MYVILESEVLNKYTECVIHILLCQCDQELHTLVAASAVHVVALVHQS